MSQLRLNQVKPPAWQEPINHQQVKHPVMMLMLDTMLIKQANPLKLLVWQGNTIQTQVRQVSLLVSMLV